MCMTSRTGSCRGIGQRVRTRTSGPKLFGLLKDSLGSIGSRPTSRYRTLKRGAYLKDIGISMPRLTRRPRKEFVCMKRTRVTGPYIGSVVKPLSSGSSTCWAFIVSSGIVKHVSSRLRRGSQAGSVAQGPSPCPGRSALKTALWGSMMWCTMHRDRRASAVGGPPARVGKVSFSSGAGHAGPSGPTLLGWRGVTLCSGWVCGHAGFVRPQGKCLPGGSVCLRPEPREGRPPKLGADPGRRS